MSSPISSAAKAASAPAQTYLVGDIGGTNCRLALAHAARGSISVRDVTHYKTADFPEASDAIDAYLKTMGRGEPLDGGVLAVAGPVRDGAVQSTNMHWSLSEANLRAHGVRGVRLINDFTALVLAVDQLQPGDFAPIGQDFEGAAGETVAVMGAGTGFGAGALVRGVAGRAAIATEGGHISFAPVDDLEIDLLKILRRRFGRVSVERLLSGPGLVNIYDALAEIEGGAPWTARAEQIVVEADAEDGLARRTLHRFCAIYGSVAGDLALAYGARGGVMIGGGIAPAIIGHLQHGDFRARFEDKGRFRDYLATVPTKIIINGDAALLGAASLAGGTIAL